MQILMKEQHERIGIGVAGLKAFLAVSNARKQRFQMGLLDLEDAKTLRVCVVKVTEYHFTSGFDLSGPRL
jgi:hypothetical protein